MGGVPEDHLIEVPCLDVQVQEGEESIDRQGGDGHGKNDLEFDALVPMHALGNDPLGIRR